MGGITHTPCNPGGPGGRGCVCDLTVSGVGAGRGGQADRQTQQTQRRATDPGINRVGGAGGQG